MKQNCALTAEKKKKKEKRKKREIKVNFFSIVKY